MGDIDEPQARVYLKHRALHRCDVAVTKSEVSGKGDEQGGGNRLSNKIPDFDSRYFGASTNVYAAMPTTSTKKTGDRGEELAVSFLEEAGYTILERNYRFEREEVDIVAYHPWRKGEGGEIVFVEVKARRGGAFGRPEEAVDDRKQQAIRRVTEAYLQERKLAGARVRFDVIGVHLGRGKPQVEHFQDAFGYF